MISASTTLRILPLNTTNPVTSGPSKVFSFDGQSRYQQDIATTGVDLATSLNDHDAAVHGDGIFERIPSPTTINRFVREYGGKLKQFLPDCVSDTEAGAVIPDDTKCYSQDNDSSYHSIQATLGKDTADNSHSLLDQNFNCCSILSAYDSV